MTASKATCFKKTPSCPSSSVLISFRQERLSSRVVALVKSHLNVCDFCSAEVRLLAHYTPGGKTDHATSELPINLRLLAESILSGKARRKSNIRGLLAAKKMFSRVN